MRLKNRLKNLEEKIALPFELPKCEKIQIIRVSFYWSSIEKNIFVCHEKTRRLTLLEDQYGDYGKSGLIWVILSDYGATTINGKYGHNMGTDMNKTLLNK